MEALNARVLIAPTQPDGAEYRAIFVGDVAQIEVQQWIDADTEPESIEGWVSVDWVYTVTTDPVVRFQAWLDRRLGG